MSSGQLCHPRVSYMQFTWDQLNYKHESFVILLHHRGKKSTNQTREEPQDLMKSQWKDSRGTGNIIIGNLIYSQGLLTGKTDHSKIIYYHYGGHSTNVSKGVFNYKVYGLKYCVNTVIKKTIFVITSFPQLLHDTRKDTQVYPDLTKKILQSV